MIVLELLPRVMGKAAKDELRSLRSFAGVEVFFVRPNMFRLGTMAGAGIIAASSFSSFFRGVAAGLRSLTLERRMSLPVPRLTLLHMLLFGLSFSSSCAGSLETWLERLLLDTCFSINEDFRDAISRLPGDGILRREGAADTVLTPDG